MHALARLVLVVALIGVTGGASQSREAPAPAVAAPPAVDRAAVTRLLGQAPLLFVEDAGRSGPEARYVARGAGEPIWLAEDGVWLTLRGPGKDDGGRGVALKLGFDGANPRPRLEPFGRLPTTVASFVGADPAAWRGGEPAWSGVRYIELYPGVDLEVSGLDGRPQWRWRGAGATAALTDRLTVDGAEVVAVEGGRLRLRTALGELALGAPAVAAGPADLPGTDLLAAGVPSAPDDDQLAAAVTASDINYGTFLGGAAGDRGYAIALDSQGMIYVAGQTSSTDFPTTAGAYDTSRNDTFGDAFVAKLNPMASGAASLVYASYLGGTQSDVAYGVAVDGLGMIYVAGVTASVNFPTKDAFQPLYGGGSNDAFFAKLNPNAAGPAGLLYGTYLGGAGGDTAYGVAVDGADNAYLTGQTASLTFPITAATAYDAVLGGAGAAGGGQDAFLVKLNPAVAGAAGLLYGTFLGGAFSAGGGAGAIGTDTGYAIAVDAAGVAYLTGQTASSANFPTVNAFQPVFGGGANDVFVAKLNPAIPKEAGLLYSSFLGGADPTTNTDSEVGRAIAIDGAGNAYVAGWTIAPNFPVTGGRYSADPDPAYTDAFVAKVNTTANGAAGLVYSTYLGGNNVDYAYGVAVDGEGAVYVTGSASATFPTTPTAYDRTWHGGDAFVAKLNPANGLAADLLYSTFLGSGEGWAVAVDAQKAVYVTGRAFSGAFPTSPNGYDRTYTGGDAFALKLLTTSGATSWYFAEGYTGTGFDEYLTIQNPNGVDSAVTITYYFPDAEPETKTLTAKANSRTTVTVHDAAQGVGRGRSVGAKVVVSNGIGIIVERPMYFAYSGPAGNNLTGGHNAMGAREPKPTWLFAEGYTGPGFDQYFTILNPNPAPVTVRVTYFLGTGATKVYTRTIAANRRSTVVVHDPNEGVGRNQFVSATIESLSASAGVVAERSMYFTYNGETKNITGGHNVMGANAAAAAWYFAEGYTGTDFDEYLTIQNANSVAVPITITYFLATGAIVTHHLTAPPTSRTTILVHDANYGGVGRGQTVSARVASDNGAGIVVERPMYFRYVGNRTGGHNAMGAAAARPTWYFAEGYTGTGFDEYLTFLNPNATAAVVTITYYLSDGTTQLKQVTINPNARYTTAVHGTSEGVGPGQTVSTKVETTNPGGIVVERPMYFTYNSTIDGGHIVVGYAP